MKYYWPTTIVLSTVFLYGCVRETTPQEFADLIFRGQMNTVATTVYYSGSDDNYDYFYLDVPLGKDDAVKILRGKADLSRRFPATRDKDQWKQYRPAIKQVPANARVEIIPGTAIKK